MKGSLTGRRIAITGAARGIGLATARSMYARGALVVIGDLDVHVAKAAARAIGSDVVALRVDVADPASFARFLAEAKRALGGLDVLVNNAGIMPVGHFTEMPLSSAIRAVDINLSGAMTGMHLALPDMLDQGSGHIVNIASVAGRAPVPGGIAYCASKAGVIAMTEAARLEFGDRGIAFTTVMPSFTNTELVSGTSGVRLLKNAEPDQVADAIARAVARRHRNVIIPGILGPFLGIQPILGHHLRDALNRRLGAHDAFLSVDHAARRSYEERIAHG